MNWTRKRSTRKQTLDRLRAIFQSSHKHITGFPGHLLMHGAGCVTIMLMCPSPGEWGDLKLVGLPTLSRFHTKYESSTCLWEALKSPYVTFQIAEPDRNVAPVFCFSCIQTPKRGTCMARGPAAQSDLDGAPPFSHCVCAACVAHALIYCCLPDFGRRQALRKQQRDFTFQQ